MKFYFFGDEFFSLKADGEYLGCFCACETDISKSCFIEAYPKSDSLPTCFLLDYPPISHKNATVYSLSDGYAVEISFAKRPSYGFKLLHQSTPAGEDGPLLTAYRDGQVNIVLENSFEADFAIAPDYASCLHTTRQGDILAVYSTQKPTYLAVFSLDPIKLLYSSIVSDFELSPVFRTKTRLFDCEGTEVTCEWKALSGGLIPTVTESCATRKFTVDNHLLKRKIFFERLLNQLPASEMLCDELKKNESALRGFIGAFIRILPDFCAQKGVCLAYGGKVRHPTKCFDIQLQDGLIENIIEL